MTTKTDIKKLIRGGLTGEEAGRLILQDNWLVDRGKIGFLDKRDMTALKSGLNTTRDVQVYNSYIELYRLVDYSMKDARIFALEAQLYLMWLDKILYGLNSKKKPATEEKREHIQTFLKIAKNMIKNFLSIQAVMDAISQIVGVDFLEDIRQWYEQIGLLVDIFNNDVDSIWTPENKWMEELGLGSFDEPYQMKIGKLKPTAKSLRYYQERMALALGEDWMREAVFNLEYEPQEEDTLAQEIAEELTEELKKRAQEARHD